MAALNNPALLRKIEVELPGETAKTGAMAESILQLPGRDAHPK